MPFSERVVDDPGLPAGISVDVSPGINGSLSTYRETLETRTGEVAIISSEVTSLSVDKVIRRGTNTDI
ncbi:G5 domain-containing protein [Trueperella sp. LYQ143]|uniref:G5 domain-containing protein n=1 Tax=unclassified Trueperella TaxID=2630174 RepID=UPI003983BD63